MLAQSRSDARALKGGDAQVTLIDGRNFNVKVTINAPRPSATLIGKTVNWLPAASEYAIQLSDASELPLEARLIFSLRAKSPAGFTRDEQLEVATTDGSFSAVLGVGTGVMLQSRKVALVSLDPSKALGPSASGPLQFRRIVEGVAGEWAPLVTLVRLPRLEGADCPAEMDVACSLTGADLFLLDSVSAEADFAHVTRVPDGFTESVLRIPHPTQGKLYVKLRDDPAVVNFAVLAVKSPPSVSTEPMPSPSTGPEHLPDRPSSGPRSEAPTGSMPMAATPPASVSEPKTPEISTSQPETPASPAVTAAKGPAVHAPQ